MNEFMEYLKEELKQFNPKLTLQDMGHFDPKSKKEVDEFINTIKLIRGLK